MSRIIWLAPYPETFDFYFFEMLELFHVLQCGCILQCNCTKLSSAFIGTGSPTWRNVDLPGCTVKSCA